MRLARSLRPLRQGLGRVGALALLGLAARSLTAQAIGQGFELERVGQFAQAAAIYFATLRAEPTNLSALLGLERVLPGLDRLPELVPVAQRATAGSPTNVALRSVLLRTYVGLSEPDSARAVAQRWIAAAPRDEAPYREWAMALEDQRRHEAARAVLVDGRHALGRSEAFGIELAELAERSGDWEGAAREWAGALSGSPAQLPYAASELGAAPPSHRDRIAHALTMGDPPPLTRRLAGELLLNWGQPERAWAVYAPSLATPSADAALAARHFADVAAGRTTPAARRVRALALARCAELASGPAAVRARAEAARALLEIGDRVAARSVLEAVARDSGAPADAQALAQTTLVAALIDGGQLDDAAQRLARDDRLTEEDRAALRLRLARGRIAQGDLDRADATLARDSSVAALALKGWIALYRGRLNDAELLFLAAGPYAGDRRDATDRTEILALLDRVAADDFAELGGALLALARGDSVRAATALRYAADQQAAAGSGRPDILLLAGRVAARLGPTEQLAALAMFAEIVRTDGSGAAAPAADLEWARLLERRLEPAAAIQHLEHLILSYPGSAVVPEARRELDRAKRAIPKS
jgi:hypothetical protein